MSIILHYCCRLVWNMGLFTSAQLFNAGRNSRQTHSQFLVYWKKSLAFLIFDVGQLIFRDSKAGMVPSALGMCRYISHSEIVCRGPKTFENPWPRGTDEHHKHISFSSQYRSENNANCPPLLPWLLLKYKSYLTSHGSRTMEFNSVTCYFTDIFSTKHFSLAVRPILLSWVLQCFCKRLQRISLPSVSR